MIIVYLNSMYNPIQIIKDLIGTKDPLCEKMHYDHLNRSSHCFLIVHANDMNRLIKIFLLGLPIFRIGEIIHKTQI